MKFVDLVLVLLLLTLDRCLSIGLYIYSFLLYSVNCFYLDLVRHVSVKNTLANGVLSSQHISTY